MKITGIELDAVHVNHRGDWVFVHVLTDAGIRGLGEMRSGNKYAAQLSALRDLGEAVTGRDPRHIEAIASHYTHTTPHQGRVVRAQCIGTSPVGYFGQVPQRACPRAVGRAVPRRNSPVRQYQPGDDRPLAPWLRQKCRSSGGTGIRRGQTGPVRRHPPGRHGP